MSDSRSEHPCVDPLASLAGGGEMGRRVRDFDWASTPLGPIDEWPQSLRSALSICLNSNFPIALYWGRDLVLLYNDEWSPIPGKKHPWVLGRPAREAWPEIWHIIEPLFQQVMATGEATRSRDQLLPMHRHGFTEECYFDYTFSPIRGADGKVDGIFNAVLETTKRVIGERRLRTLRELGSWNVGASGTVEQACETVTRILAENPHDLPFALLYLNDGKSRARLAGTSGLAESSAASPQFVELDSRDAPWPFQLVVETGKPAVVENLSGRFGSLSGGAWPESPERAIVLPIAKTGQGEPAGFVVAGISPRLAFNDDYAGFLDLLVRHVAAAIANAQAYEIERQRAETLAELDRAKTAFFSNVSHEFRTPLTLMLGPVEDMLAKPADEVLPDNRDLLTLVHRNGLRLQRLVNSLLEFSRIEAGRVRATFEPTDLAEFTVDLASNFRSACERAGLALKVDCAPLSESVFVDRQLYEKIVLNLLSNAFKFTFDGEIAVSLRWVGNAVVLQVRDTGSGIPSDEMPKLFERFHRIENAHGRTHEGSGIGLALVQELVKLHGGAISAESELGRGTAFTVTLPTGNEHLPSNQVRHSQAAPRPSAAVTSFVQEALHWLPGEDETLEACQDDLNLRLAGVTEAAAALPRIIVADDNADMRNYVVRLLSGKFSVEAVPDGQAALEAVRRAAPDLVLSDVMMPHLDGFQLLRTLRADAGTASIPVILLSARAGEESRVGGVEAGADDYLVKPFSARELLARVMAQVQMSRLRREASESLRAQQAELNEAQRLAHVGSWRWDAATDVTVGSDELYRIYGLDPARHAFPEFKNQDGTLYPHEEWERLSRAVEQTVRTGVGYELDVRALRNGEQIWVTARSEAVTDASGSVIGLRGTVQDITDRKRAEQTARQSEEQLRAVVETSPACIKVVAADGTLISMNSAGLSMVEAAKLEEVQGHCVYNLIAAEDRDAFRELNERVCRGKVETLEFEIEGLCGTRRRMETHAVPLRGPDGHYRQLAITHDITDRKQAEDALHESERRFRQLADAMPQIVWTARPDGEIDYLNRRWTEFTGFPDNIGNKGWSEILHQEDAPAARERWAASLQNREPFEMEVRLLDRREDSYRWHLIRTVAAKDDAGNVVRWFGTSTDIHQQKRAEESSRYLAEASAALAGVVDYESTLQTVANLAIPHFADWSAVDVADGDGRLRRLAVAHEDQGKVALVGQLMKEYPPDPQSPFGAYAVFRSGNPEFVAEISDDMLAKSARDERHLALIRSLGLKSLICVPLVVSGTRTGVLTFATAESGRKYNEADLALAVDLTRRAAVAIENTQLYQALKVADRRKDEFLATLAHELRNPLAPLRNGLQVLRLGGMSGEMAEDARTMMERQLSQMVHLIDDLLDLSRISRGKIALRKERVELARIVQQAVETSRPAIEHAGHDLMIDVPPSPVYVDADVTRLAQVFSNLLNNAAKYTEHGGRIRLAVQQRDGQVVLSVQDNGVGIPAHMLPHVFDMFTQVDRNLERAQGGLGIGLSIVKRLVEMHGGSVEAKSDGHGMGSEFTVRLPAVLSVFQRQIESPQAARASARCKVLVVDDNRDAATSLAMMLKLMGNEATTAHDGQEALDVAAVYRPDLVLLDIGMPKMNGYEAARRIRQQAWGKRMVLVALTGWGQEEDRRRSHEAGFDAHMTKPIEPAALEQLLGTLQADTA